MKKHKFSKCFACFLGDDCAGTRLSRKKKKYMKKMISSVLLSEGVGAYCYPDSCDLGGAYESLISRMKIAEKNLKYEAALLRILGTDDGDEGITIKSDMSLNWNWEGDNGLYSYGGTMPFQYQVDDSGTWAFSATKDLVEELGFSLKEVCSDRDLIMAVHNQIRERK